MLHNVNAVSATTAANVADQQVIDVIGVSAEERLVKLRWSQVCYALKLQQNKHKVRLEGNRLYMSSAILLQQQLELQLYLPQSSETEDLIMLGIQMTLCLYLLMSILFTDGIKRAATGVMLQFP